MIKNLTTGFSSQSSANPPKCKTPKTKSTNEEPPERPLSSFAIKSSKELKSFSPDSISPSARFERKHMRFKKLFKNHFTPRKLQASSKSSKQISRSQNKELSFLSQVKTSSHFRSSSDEKIEKYFEELSKKMKKIEERAKIARKLKITYSEKLSEKLEKAKAARFELEMQQNRNNYEKTNQLSKSLIESSKRRKEIFQQQSKKMLVSLKGLSLAKLKMQQMQHEGEKSKVYVSVTDRKVSKKIEKIDSIIVCKSCNKNVIKTKKIQESRQNDDQKTSKLKSLSEALQKRIHKKIQEINEDSDITFY